MARIALTIPNPRTLNRRIESTETILTEKIVEIDFPMTESERLDTSIRLFLDAFYSIDGINWIHRLRYSWQGGTFSDDLSNELPRETLIQLSLPANSRVKLSAQKAV